MPDVNAQLIGLLRDFAQGSESGLCVQGDATVLLTQTAQQNLMPILTYENKRKRIFSDEELSRQLDGLLHAAVAGSLRRCTAFESLSYTFTERGIEHMPVKGYYLRELYPVPELRTFGDIDILIRPTDRKKAHELMRELGYQTGNDWEPTYSYRKGEEHYEIHTNLMDGNLDDRADLRAYFDTAWEHAEPDEGLRRRPTADFHFIYIICHLAKHLYSGGAGLRMYLDAALFVRRFDSLLDWNAIRNEFATLRLDKFFDTVMNACRCWFGTETMCPLPEPNEKRLMELLSYTLSSDLFGHSRDHAIVQLRNEGEQSSARGKALLRELFPPASALEPRYTFLRRSRLLLPLAWVVRPFVNLKLIPKRLRHMNRLATTDDENVKSYDDFISGIGL